MENELNIEPKTYNRNTDTLVYALGGLGEVGRTCTVMNIKMK